jgi:hypothetical protein
VVVVSGAALVGEAAAVVAGPAGAGAGAAVVAGAPLLVRGAECVDVTLDLAVVGVVTGAGVGGAGAPPPPFFGVIDGSYFVCTM